MLRMFDCSCIFVCFGGCECFMEGCAEGTLTLQPDFSSKPFSYRSRCRPSAVTYAIANVKIEDNWFYVSNRTGRCKVTDHERNSNQGGSRTAPPPTVHIAFVYSTSTWKRQIDTRSSTIESRNYEGFRAEFCVEIAFDRP